MKMKTLKRAGIWTEETKCKNHTVDLNCILVNPSILSPFQDKVKCEQIVNTNIKRSSRIKGFNEIKLCEYFFHLLNIYWAIIYSWYYEETKSEKRWFLKRQWKNKLYQHTKIYVTKQSQA